MVGETNKHVYLLNPFKLTDYIHTIHTYFSMPSTSTHKNKNKVVSEGKFMFTLLLLYNCFWLYIICRWYLVFNKTVCINIVIPLAVEFFFIDTCVCVYVCFNSIYEMYIIFVDLNVWFGEIPFYFMILLLYFETCLSKFIIFVDFLVYFDLMQSENYWVLGLLGDILFLIWWIIIERRNRNESVRWAYSWTMIPWYDKGYM